MPQELHDTTMVNHLFTDASQFKMQIFTITEEGKTTDYVS